MIRYELIWIVIVSYFNYFFVFQCPFIIEAYSLVLMYMTFIYTCHISNYVYLNIT